MGAVRNSPGMTPATGLAGLQRGVVPKPKTAPKAPPPKTGLLGKISKVVGDLFVSPAAIPAPRRSSDSFTMKRSAGENYAALTTGNASRAIPNDAAMLADLDRIATA